MKIVEPGVVDDMGGPASIHIGMLDDTQNPTVDEIRSRFESVGVTCPPVDDITTELQQASCAVIVATHDRQMLRDFTDWPHLNLDLKEML